MFKNVSCLPKYWVPYIQWIIWYNTYLYQVRSENFQMKCQDRLTKTIYSRTEAMVLELRDTRVRKIRVIRLHIVIHCYYNNMRTERSKSTRNKTNATDNDRSWSCVYERGCEWPQQTDAYNIILYNINIILYNS